MPTTTNPAQVRITEFASQYLKVALTPAQSQTLWDEVRACLVGRELAETVAEMETAEVAGDGGLDTLERDDGLSAMAHVLAGQDWLINGDTEESRAAFGTAMAAALDTREYASVGLMSKTLKIWNSRGYPCVNRKGPGWTDSQEGGHRAVVRCRKQPSRRWARNRGILRAGTV